MAQRLQLTVESVAAGTGLVEETQMRVLSCEPPRQPRHRIAGMLDAAQKLGRGCIWVAQRHRDGSLVNVESDVSDRIFHDLFLLVAALHRTVDVSVTRAIRGGTGHTIVSTPGEGECWRSVRA